MAVRAARDLGNPTRRHLTYAIAAVESLGANEIPATLAHVEELRAHLWRRLLLQPPVTQSRPPDAKFLTVSEVADALRFSRGHVYELIRAGDLQAVKNGRAVRVTPDALTAWQSRHQRPALDPAYSVSLESAGDRTQGKAHPRDPRPDSVRVRETPRCAPGDGGEVGDGRSRDARPRRPAHRASGQHRAGAGREEECPSAAPGDTQQGAAGN
jgi:excisionase family DNA binding protein